MSEEVAQADATLTALYQAQQEIQRLMDKNNRLLADHLQSKKALALLSASPHTRAGQTLSEAVQIVLTALEQADERAKTASDAYNRQQSSQRELEVLYQDATVRAQRAEAEAALFREACEAVLWFWSSDPHAFGDEASVTSLAGRFANIAETVRRALRTGAGEAALKEWTAARAYLQYVLDTYPPTSDHEQQLRDAYVAAVKARQGDGG